MAREADLLKSIEKSRLFSRLCKAISAHRVNLSRSSLVNISFTVSFLTTSSGKARVFSEKAKFDFYWTAQKMRQSTAQLGDLIAQVCAEADLAHVCC